MEELNSRSCKLVFNAKAELENVGVIVSAEVVTPPASVVRKNPSEVR